MAVDMFDNLREINATGRLAPIHPSATLVGFGVNMSDHHHEGVIAIPDAERGGHFGCLGTTGIGKTRLVESIVEQDIRKGFSVVIMDPKGDIDLFSKIAQVAAESGRLDELMFLNSIFPDKSMYIDPLADFYMEDELVNHVVSGIKAKDDFYISIAHEVSQVIVAGLIKLIRSQGESVKISFSDIYDRLGFSDLEQFKEALRAIPGTDEICRRIEKICHGPGVAEHFHKISASLRTMLSALTFGNVGRVIGKARTNEFVKRLQEGKRVIMVVHTGSLLTPRASVIFSRVFVSMIQSMVGRFFASGLKLNPPLCLHIDEGHNVLYTGIQELFNKARGANVWINFYTQSNAQISVEVGDDMGRSIVDNINSWLYFRVNHAETAQHVEDSSPLVQRPEPIISVAGHVTLRMSDQRLVLRDRVMHLMSRWFYMRTQGHWFKGKTLDSSASYVNITFPIIGPGKA